MLNATLFIIAMFAFCGSVRYLVHLFKLRTPAISYATYEKKIEKLQQKVGDFKESQKLLPPSVYYAIFTLFVFGTLVVMYCSLMYILAHYSS